MRATFLFLTLCLVGCNQVPTLPTVEDAPNNPDLVAVAKGMQYQIAPVSPREHSILRRIIPEDSSAVLRSIVLMKNEDRIAAVFWYRHPFVARHMELAKQEVFRQSQALKDIVDRSYSQEGFVPIHVLAVSDSALEDERVIIVRIRDELYEFHTTNTNETFLQEIFLKIATGK